METVPRRADGVADYLGLARNEGLTPFSIVPIRAPITL